MWKSRFVFWRNHVCLDFRLEENLNPDTTLEKIYTHRNCLRFPSFVFIFFSAIWRPVLMLGREAPPVTGGAATRPATSPERTTAPDPDLKTNHHQSRQPFRYIHTFIYNLCIFVVQKKPCWKIKRYHVPICISEPIQPFFLNWFSAAKIVKC